MSKYVTDTCYSFTRNVIIIIWNKGPVYKGTNYVPKAVSDRDPLRDWDRDFNYVRSQALQTSRRPNHEQDLRTAT